MNRKNRSIQQIIINSQFPLKLHEWLISVSELNKNKEAVEEENNYRKNRPKA